MKIKTAPAGPSQAGIDDESVKRIITAPREVNEVYRQAKARNDNSHDGLFRMVGV